MLVIVTWMAAHGKSLSGYFLGLSDTLQAAWLGAAATVIAGFLAALVSVLAAFLAAYLTQKNANISYRQLARESEHRERRKAARKIVDAVQALQFVVADESLMLKLSNALSRTQSVVSREGFYLAGTPLDAANDAYHDFLRDEIEKLGELMSRRSSTSEVISIPEESRMDASERSLLYGRVTAAGDELNGVLMPFYGRHSPSSPGL